MNVGLQIDASQLFQRFGNPDRKLAYAAVGAINQTAKLFQATMRREARRRFVVRKSSFIDREIAIIKPFASVGQGRPYAEVAVGQKQRLLLPIFEEGGERKPFYPGSKTVAVPLTGSPARPGFASQVPKPFTISGLLFKAYLKGRKRAIPKRTTRSGALSLFDEYGRRRNLEDLGVSRLQWKGRQRTFILGPTANAPHGGIYRRVGKKREDIRMLYSFEADTELKARLGFYATAEAIGRTYFQRFMQVQLVDALKHEARS